MSGNGQVIRRRKGTAVSNTYQKTSRRAQPDHRQGELAVPEQVIVSMAEIAESAKEGLLALAVGTGLQVMAAMFGEEDAERLCGRRAGTTPAATGTGTAARPGRSRWAAAGAGDPSAGAGRRRVRRAAPAQL